MEMAVVRARVHGYRDLRAGMNETHWQRLALQWHP
jgi:hypothetical protein